MRERIKWVDTAKFLGILAIYLGHAGTVLGKTYVFVWYYHVPLFFFLSGCMSIYDKEKNLGSYVIKKVKRLLLPFWAFSMIAIIGYSMASDVGLAQIGALLKVVCKGNIRNTFISPALWFLSCLFCMEILFKIMKYLKRKWILFGISVGMFLIAEKVIVPRPIVEPHWFYNLDSMFYYMIYYAAGYSIYPYLLELFKMDTKKKGVLFGVLTMVSTIYAAFLFLGQDGLRGLDSLPVIGIFSSVIKAFLLIYVNLAFAKLLENIEILNKIGQETLFLCGNEFIMRMLIPMVVEWVGLNITAETQIQGWFYTCLLLAAGIKVFIPIERKVIDSSLRSLRLLK